jgi:hypothetical protein
MIYYSIIAQYLFEQNLEEEKNGKGDSEIRFSEIVQANFNMSVEVFIKTVQFNSVLFIFVILS